MWLLNGKAVYAPGVAGGTNSTKHGIDGNTCQATGMGQGNAEHGEQVRQQRGIIPAPSAGGAFVGA